MQLQVEYLPVERLRPYERNVRAHSDYDIDNIVKSIDKYGFNDPIGIWSEENIIVEGHGRLEAAIKVGLTEVPCIRLDHLTDRQRREYAILHNKTAELSQWDDEKLKEEINALDLSDFEALTDIFGKYFDMSIDPPEPREKGEKDKKTITCPNCGKEFEV